MHSSRVHFSMSNLFTPEDQREEMEGWIRGVEKGCQFLQKAMDGCPAMGLVLVKKQLGEKLMEYANRSLSPAPLENAHLQSVFPSSFQ